jgi:hypothetical protein
VSPPRSQFRSPPSRAQSPARSSPPKSKLSPSGRDPLELAGVFYRGGESEVKHITKPDLLYLGEVYHAPVSPDMKKADIEAAVRDKQNSYLDADARVSADRRALADDRAAVSADRLALDRDIDREEALEYDDEEPRTGGVSRKAEVDRTPLRTPSLSFFADLFPAQPRSPVSRRSSPRSPGVVSTWPTELDYAKWSSPGRTSPPPPSRRTSPRSPSAARSPGVAWPSPLTPSRLGRASPRSPASTRSPAGDAGDVETEYGAGRPWLTVWNADDWVLPHYFREVDVREFTRLAKTAHEDKTEDVGNGLVMHLAKRPEEKYARRLYAVGLSTDPDEYQQMKYLVAEPPSKRDYDNLVKLHTGAWTNFPYRTSGGETTLED